jgi:TrwC relaxase
VAGSLTIGKGASPGYYTEQATRGTDYYAAGAGSEKRGSEPAGVWTGDGCPDLGLQVGAEADDEGFGYIFGSHVDPRGGSRIGRAMRHRDAEEIYETLLDAEPGATAERRGELFARAQAQVVKSRPVAFFDATFSVSKSITLLHASARAMKLASEDAGDVEGAARARALEEKVWSAISAGAAAGMAHLQRHAGYTRTGAGGVRHEDAHGWVVASWRQHTSRAGDPQRPPIPAQPGVRPGLAPHRAGPLRSSDHALPVWLDCISVRAPGNQTALSTPFAAMKARATGLGECKRRPSRSNLLPRPRTEGRVATPPQRLQGRQLRARRDRADSRLTQADHEQGPVALGVAHVSGQHQLAGL